jgi:hypothetical protein
MFLNVSRGVAGAISAIPSQYSVGRLVGKLSRITQSAAAMPLNSIALYSSILTLSQLKSYAGRSRYIVRGDNGAPQMTQAGGTARTYHPQRPPVLGPRQLGGTKRVHEPPLLIRKLPVERREGLLNALLEVLA